MKLLTKAGAIFDCGIGAFAFLAAVILIFIWGLISTEVIVRFLVDYSIPWYMEVSELGVVAATFLGAAWLLRKEGHVKIDIVSSRLNPRAQALLNIITSIIGVVICLFLVWYETKVTIDHFQRGVVSDTVMRMVTWPRYAVISVGCLLLLIQFWRRFYANLMLWKMAKGKEVALSQEQLDLKGEA